LTAKARIAVTAVAAHDDVSLAPVLAPGAIEDRLASLAGQSPDLVLLPQYSVQSDTDEEKLRRFAADNRCYVVYNLLRAGNRCVSVLLDRAGAPLGEYVKSHRVDGLDFPDLVLGDDFPIFELDFGKVAVLAGTDILIPEIAEIYSVKGAEILLVQLGPQVLRDDAESQRLLKARAIADYVYVAAASYASVDPLYMASNVELYHADQREIVIGDDWRETFNVSGLGKHAGRAVIYDLRGEIVGGTGRESGTSVCELDLQRKRSLRSYNYGTGCILFHQNERGVFRDLGRGYAPERRSYDISNPVLSMVQLPYKDTFQNTASDWYAPILATIEQAAQRHSDLIVCSEYSRGDGLTVTTSGLDVFLQGCSRIAAQYACYVAVNEVLDGMNSSIVFGRDGKEIHRHAKVNPLNMMYENKPPAGELIEPVELDFGKVGFMICADSYCQEIPRVYGIKDTDLVVLQTQSWGYDANAINEGVARAWAIENSLFVATCCFPSSQTTHRSNVIDPTGETVFASDYDLSGIYTTRINLDAGREKTSFIYENGRIFRDTAFRERLMRARRPELYVLLSEGRTT